MLPVHEGVGISPSSSFFSKALLHKRRLILIFVASVMWLWLYSRATRFESLTGLYPSFEGAEVDAEFDAEARSFQVDESTAAGAAAGSDRDNVSSATEKKRPEAPPPAPADSPRAKDAIAKSVNTAPVPQSPSLTGLPVLMVACSRPHYTSQTLQSLKRTVSADTRRPKGVVKLVVSLGCLHAPTKKVVEEFAAESKDVFDVVVMEHRDLPPEGVPYARIAVHYKYAISRGFDAVYPANEKSGLLLVVEDDLVFSPDAYMYYRSLCPILVKDETLMAVSGWNDHGMFSWANPAEIIRTDFFPGLGWCLRSSLWRDELEPKWPRVYWDDWLRKDEHRRGRQIIAPLLPRTHTIGETGVSHGQFFHEKLSKMAVASSPVNWTAFVASGGMQRLTSAAYNETMFHTLRDSSLSTVCWQCRTPAELRSALETSLSASGSQAKHIVVLYQGVNEQYRQRYGPCLTGSGYMTFEQWATPLRVMSDEKVGAPRMAYKGIVTLPIPFEDLKERSAAKGNPLVYFVPCKSSYLPSPPDA